MYSPPPPKRDTSVVDALNNLAQAIRETKQETDTPVVKEEYKPNRRNNLYE